MSFQAAPMCTVAWPEIPWVDNAWILGWNPRGLVLAVAAFVTAPTLLEAQSIVRQRLAVADTRDRRKIPRNLRIIGRLRRNEAVNDGPDGGARAARTAADIWIELTPGPALADLYCCGYKHRAQLHVIRCDPNCRKFQTTPTSISVLSHWGIAGLAALLAGGKPLLGSDAESSIEGPILAPHAAQLFAPKATQPSGLSSTVMQTEIGDVPPSDEHAGAHRETPVKNTSLVADRSGESTNKDDNGFAADLLGPVATSTSSSASPQIVLPGRPPRLDFPTTADKTELSDVFACLNSGVIIRKSLANTRPTSSAARSTVPNLSSGRSLLSSVLAPLISVLLAIQAVVTVISKASYVGRVLDFRLRELVNWLSLVSGQTTSCGLQPLIPHILDNSCPASRRRLCIWGFVTRVFGDVFLGMVIVVLLLTWEEPLVAAVRFTGWFGLYEVHMGYISWFVGWPAGFKMNDDLNVVLSFVTRSVLRTWRDVVTHESFQDQDIVGHVYRAWVVVSCFGASFAFAFVADCSNVVTQHLRLAFHFMSVIYKCFQSLLSCLLLMFRGRKNNPLRKRVDASDFSVDQMLFGALLATATTFLFPTLALYYFYLAFVRMIVWLVQELLSAVSFVCCYLPIFPILYWLTSRFALPSGVELSDPSYRSPPTTSPTVSTASPTSLSPSPQLPIIDVTLRIKPMPITEAFVDLLVVTWLVSRPFAIPRLIAFVLNADNKPLVTASTDVFPHLAASSTNPPLTVKC
jgi:hypothetical protein